MHTTQKFCTFFVSKGANNRLRRGAVKAMNCLRQTAHSRKAALFVEGVPAHGANVLQAAALETGNEISGHQPDIGGIGGFLLNDGFVEAGGKTIDEINVGGELLMFLSGDTARHEDSQMPDCFMNTIDDRLAGGQDVLIALV